MCVKVKSTQSPHRVVEICGVIPQGHFVENLWRNTSSVTCTQNSGRAMEEAVDIYQRTKAVDKLEIANTLNSLAALYWNQGEFDRAEDVTLESLELRKEMLGSDHADIAETLINLANVSIFFNSTLRLISLLDVAFSLSVLLFCPQDEAIAHGT